MMTKPRAVLASLAIFFATGELATRLTNADWKLLAPLLYYQGADLEVHQPSDSARLLYELRKSASAVIQGREIRTNALGFRDRERSPRKPSGVFRIVCLGSSNTYGAFVENAETYPARMEALLNAQRHSGTVYEVWNAGVSAYTLDQSLASAEEIVDRYSPDLLIMQMHSTGRRPFLLGYPFDGYFARDPGLYLENLRYLPFGGTRLDARLMRGSRFFALAVIAVNRFSLLRPNNPAYDGDAPSREALRRFHEMHGREIPLVMLNNPGHDGVLIPELGLRSISLDEHLPRNYSADYLRIHPQEDVYRWYAATIVAALRADRLLPRR